MARRRRRTRRFGAISISRACPREGLRVVFNANPASRALYGYRVPRNGEGGRVTTVPVPGGRKTCMRGPGGGLVYVKWDSGFTTGVSSIDLDRAKR